MEIDRLCRRCGKPFVAFKANRQFCSSDCRTTEWKKDIRHKPPKEEKKCKHCGILFLSSDDRKVFCSQKCNYSFHNAERETTKSKRRECPECHEQFVPMQKRGVGKKYCSNQCKNKHTYNKNHKTILERQRSWVKKNKFDGNWELALKRDSYTCQLCKKQLYPSQWSNSKLLVVHHRDGSGEKDNKNHELSNLLTLCSSCHLEYHTKINLVEINGEYFVRGKIFGLLGLTSVKAVT